MAESLHNGPQSALPRTCETDSSTGFFFTPAARARACWISRRAVPQPAAASTEEDMKLLPQTCASEMLHFVDAAGLEARTYLGSALCTADEKPVVCNPALRALLGSQNWCAACLPDHISGSAAGHCTAS